MKQTIWKLELSGITKQKLMLPIGAKILTVQVQNNCPCIWFLCNPENDKEERFLEVYGTGHDIQLHTEIDRYYLATFQIGSLVFHVFEII